MLLVSNCRIWSLRKIDPIKKPIEHFEVHWKDFEELLHYYLDDLLRNKKETMVRRTTLIKELEENMTPGNKIDIFLALFKILTFDAQSGRNFPMQFYQAADVVII
jgi:hypothetical protein